jgi:phytoene dehydrogenase-like protein
MVDPDTKAEHVAFRFFHFDPTFAPLGKTAVTSILPTRNFTYWTDLRRNSPIQYYAEKNRIVETVIGILDRRIPGIRNAIEVTDISTPATVIRYTGNWHGSQEGWLFKPGEGMRMLPNSLPGLKQFMMVGQWIMPGGGLPSGPMTARPTIKSICRHDRVRFSVDDPVHQEEPVGV